MKLSDADDVGMLNGGLDLQSAYGNLRLTGKSTGSPVCEERKLSKASHQLSMPNIYSEDYEEELRHQREVMQDVKEQLEKVHKNEIDKLSNEKREISKELKSAKEKIKELQNLIQSQNKDLFPNGDVDEIGLQLKEQRVKVTELESKIKILENLNKQVELDNETLAFKLTEALSQYDDLEDQLRRERHKNHKETLMKERVEDSPSKMRVDSLHSLLDNRISSAQNDLSMVNQIKKLQSQLGKMQEDLMEITHRNEVLMIKYHQRKARYREKIHQLRGELEEQLRDWKVKLHDLNKEKELAEAALQKEKEWRSKVEQDCMKLLEEKRQLLLRLVETEEVYRSEKVVTYLET